MVGDRPHKVYSSILVKAVNGFDQVPSKQDLLFLNNNITSDYMNRLWTSKQASFKQT